eukprot:GCRY01003112.1.p1 GENE.GCRY01003112.1~~GCRY01003112.1.p1  ORF type:complete len:438 (-),score=5.27 GCRY01003112.1:24-1337(-)
MNSTKASIVTVKHVNTGDLSAPQVGTNSCQSAFRPKATVKDSKIDQKESRIGSDSNAAQVNSHITLLEAESFKKEAAKETCNLKQIENDNFKKDVTHAKLLAKERKEILEQKNREYVDEHRRANRGGHLTKKISQGPSQASVLTTLAKVLKSDSDQLPKKREIVEQIKLERDTKRTGWLSSQTLLNEQKKFDNLTQKYALLEEKRLKEEEDIVQKQDCVQQRHEELKMRSKLRQTRNLLSDSHKGGLDVHARVRLAAIRRRDLERQEIGSRREAEVQKQALLERQQMERASAAEAETEARREAYLHNIAILQNRDFESQHAFHSMQNFQNYRAFQRARTAIKHSEYPSEPLDLPSPKETAPLPPSAVSTSVHRHIKGTVGPFNTSGFGSKSVPPHVGIKKPKPLPPLTKTQLYASPRMTHTTSPEQLGGWGGTQFLM